MKIMRFGKLIGLGGVAALLMLGACDVANEDADATGGDASNGGGEERPLVGNAISLVDDTGAEDLIDCEKAKLPDGQYAPGADIEAIVLETQDGAIHPASKQSWRLGDVCAQNDFADPSAVLGAPGSDTYLSLNGGLLNVEFEGGTPVRVGDTITIYAAQGTGVSKLSRMDSCENINGFCETDSLFDSIAIQPGEQVDIPMETDDAKKADSATLF
jgi:hypothetical protein